MSNEAFSENMITKTSTLSFGGREQVRIGKPVRVLLFVNASALIIDSASQPNHF